MIAINNIIPLVNNSLSGHYFKDITFYNQYVELLKQNSEDQVERPAVWEGSGNYRFIQEDTKGLICYHRILEQESEDDNEGGFGKNPLTTNIYSMRVVFFGNRNAIDKDCSDINELLAREFKALLPRKMSLVDRNVLNAGKVYSKPLELSEEEGIAWQPEMVLFGIDYEFRLTSTRNCDDLSCDSEVLDACKPVTILDSSGNVLATVPSGDSYTETGSGPCDDATVRNSDSSYSNNVASGGTLILPDIQFTDSDGSTSSIPSVKDIVATPCVVQSGIAYQRPQLTGQTTSYRTGDDAWSLANGIYDYTPPIYPISFAQLDTTSGSPFLTLKENNAFGNKNRFTDINGLQVYGDNYAIDHLTGLGWYLIESSDTWNNAIDNSQSSTQNSFNDWRLPSRIELISVLNMDIIPLNYSPFNSTMSSLVWTSTTNHDNTTTAHVSSSNGNLARAVKTDTNNYLMCRNHYT